VSPDLVYRTDEQLVDRDVLGLGHGVEHGGGDRSTLSSKPGCAERSDSLNAFTANFVAAYAATGGERCARRSTTSARSPRRSSTRERGVGHVHQPEDVPVHHAAPVVVSAPST
jgi:hypothetical protein